MVERPDGSARREPSKRRPAAYVGAIVANIVMVWVVNAIPGWEWPFVTTDFPAVLWAVNLSLGMQIAGNALLVFYHPRFLHHLVQAVLNAVSLLALIIVVTVYPFDFTTVIGDGANTVARVLLYVALGGTAIAILVNALQALGSLFGSRSE